LHTYTEELYIYASAAADCSRAFALLGKVYEVSKAQCDTGTVGHSLVSNQDELRRKLRRRGFEVTQATLSRDIHELRFSKGPGGYSLPNGNNGSAPAAAVEDDGPPAVAEMIESFGLRVRQAMNQVVVRTVMGGAQPVAAALDREGVAGSRGHRRRRRHRAGHLSRPRRAAEVEAGLGRCLES
jgi:transcriptional regulator of arginine metabolism